MRTTIAVGFLGGRFQPVLNLHGEHNEVVRSISDRQANDQAFEYEQPVRLPRRLGVNRHSHLPGNFGGGYIASRHYKWRGRTYRNTAVS